MKKLVLLFSLLLSFSTFAGEVISCKGGPNNKIVITKEGAKYFYTVNGEKKLKLYNAQTVPAKDFNKEDFLKELVDFMGIHPSRIDRANVYQLTADDDGGKTIVRFWVDGDNYVAAYITMAISDRAFKEITHEKSNSILICNHVSNGLCTNSKPDMPRHK